MERKSQKSGKLMRKSERAGMWCDHTQQQKKQQLVDDVSFAFERLLYRFF